MLAPNHLFGYAGVDPVNMIDPSGRLFENALLSSQPLPEIFALIKIHANTLKVIGCTISILYAATHTDDPLVLLGPVVACLGNIGSL